MKSQDAKEIDGGALAALDNTTSVHEGIIDQQSIKPKVYKRRFIGMAILFALNLCSSMAWIDMASVVDFAAEHFSTSTSAINWFSTSFLFVALAVNWPASRTTRKSVKLSMVISSAIMIAGTWVMYGGTCIKSFGLSLFGHCIIAVSQPFVLILPALFSEVWFESGSRATATAVSSIANILGSTVGQFIMTAWVKSEEDVTRGILYQSILLTVVGCMVVFVPPKPPTPPELVVANKRTLSQRQELQALLTRVEFYLVAIPFGMLSGIFNALSFLIFQMCMPYGFTADQCTIAVCLVIVPGLVTSLIVCRAADMFRCHKWVLKTLAAITGAGFLAFIWVPPSGSIAFLYCISIIISIGVVGSGPIAVEFVAEIIYPLGPELAIAIMWAMGQLLGGVLTIGEGYMSDKNGGLQPGVYLQAALALFCVPFTLSLGLWGRHKHVQLNRTRAEKAKESPNIGDADETILSSKAAA
ncbi:major facilitator superfamily transporter [Fusarium phyllophilum]|uniref:Major facilitator superfamily transporter n=1 Tax=Fusarium phyllophilum TaxID=47803 RepID=A0A8H5ID47_9HYPO|nr:major facilitator superfamily transporter [Fusarium phyllophilum]